MKAIVLHRPGVLALQERALPEPQKGEVRVRVHYGGICGSDLHYFLHGGFGTVRMREPMILGHEFSGVIDAIGAGVTGRAVGERVAVNPSLACGECEYCQQGALRHCVDMRFMGSAMKIPHVQGGFREYVVCTQAQAVPISAEAGLDEAAVSEPLAVCLHAVSQAPDLTDKRVLVSGFGPIGALCLLAARHAGAGALAASDIARAPLDLAERLKADWIYDGREAGALAAEERGRGQFDVVFECSGHPAALATAIAVTRPGGTIIQVGILPDTVPVALNPLVTKEITLRGTFRFDNEFDRAAALIASRAIDVRPVISRHFPVGDAGAAFAFAGDRSNAIKVMLDFT